MKFFALTEMVFFQKDPDNQDASPGVLDGLTIERRNDAANIPYDFSINEAVSKTWADRFAAGHIAVVARLHGEPCHLAWVAHGNLRIDELGFSWQIPEGDRCIYDCRTLPEFRGQGIYPVVLQWIAGTSTVSTNSCHIWIYSDSRNKPSLKGIEQAGFKETGRMQSIALFGKPIRTTSTMNIG